MGSASGLHIIIFDEIDAICKERGTVVCDCMYPKLGIVLNILDVYRI